MTFRDLQETLARLANDPRIHPNTRVDIATEHEIYAHYAKDCEGHLEYVPPETIQDVQPLLAITLNGSLTLSTHRSEPAVAR